MRQQPVGTNVLAELEEMEIEIWMYKYKRYDTITVEVVALSFLLNNATQWVPFPDESTKFSIPHFRFSWGYSANYLVRKRLEIQTLEDPHADNIWSAAEAAARFSTVVGGGGAASVWS